MARKEIETNVRRWFEVISAAATRSLRAMMRQPLELIEIIEDPSSGRQKLVGLTPKGRFPRFSDRTSDAGCGRHDRGSAGGAAGLRDPLFWTPNARLRPIPQPPTNPSDPARSAAYSNPERISLRIRLIKFIYFFLPTSPATLDERPHLPRFLRRILRSHDSFDTSVPIIDLDQPKEWPPFAAENQIVKPVKQLNECAPLS